MPDWMKALGAVGPVRIIAGPDAGMTGWEARTPQAQRSDSWVPVFHEGDRFPFIHWYHVDDLADDLEGA